MVYLLAIIALLITFILVPVLIPTLKRMKFGQSIREEGPQSHMKKTGTPTMGGLTFLLSIIVTSILAIIFMDNANPIILLLLDRKSTRLNSSHVSISYAVFCLKKKN